MKKILLGTLAISLILFSCKGGEKKAAEAQQPEQAQQAETQKPAKLFNTDSLGTEPQFDIVTSMGTIRIKLYEDTPKHKKNFIRLASEGYFDGMQFHRVINNFMIQTGDPYTKYSETEYPQAYQSYGTGGPGYTIPAEIVNTHKHKKGALAAARKGDTSNPEKASSGWRPSVSSILSAACESRLMASIMFSASGSIIMMQRYRFFTAVWSCR